MNIISKALFPRYVEYWKKRLGIHCARIREPSPEIEGVRTRLLDEQKELEATPDEQRTAAIAALWYVDATIACDMFGEPSRPVDL